MNEKVEIKVWTLLLFMLIILMTTFNNTYEMLKKPTEINIYIKDGNKLDR